MTWETLFSAISWIIAFGGFGYIAYHNYPLPRIMDFNLGVIKWVSSWFKPLEIDQGLETALRYWGVDRTLILVEIKTVAALSLRVIGLGFLFLRFCVKSMFPTHRREREEEVPEMETEIAPAGQTTEEESEMNMPARPSNIGKFLLGLILSIVLIGGVWAILFRGFVLDFNFEAFGIAVEKTVYVFAAAAAAYKAQKWMSESYGTLRFIDHVVSWLMLGVIALAVAVWMNIPVLHTVVRWLAEVIGQPIPLESTIDQYKLTVMLIFGSLALWDVFLRDTFSVGRWRHAFGHGNDARNENLVSGAHGHLPDVPHVLASESETDEYLFPADARVVIRRVVMADPLTGQDVSVRLTERQRMRLMRHLRQQPAAEVVTPPPAGDGGGNA